MRDLSDLSLVPDLQTHTQGIPLHTNALITLALT